MGKIIGIDLGTTTEHAPGLQPHTVVEVLRMRAARVLISA